MDRKDDGLVEIKQTRTLESPRSPKKRRGNLWTSSPRSQRIPREESIVCSPREDVLIHITPRKPSEELVVTSSVNPVVERVTFPFSRVAKPGVAYPMLFSPTARQGILEIRGRNTKQKSRNAGEKNHLRVHDTSPPASHDTLKLSIPPCTTPNKTVKPIIHNALHEHGWVKLSPYRKKSAKNDVRAKLESGSELSHAQRNPTPPTVRVVRKRPCSAPSRPKGDSNRYRSFFPRQNTQAVFYPSTSVNLACTDDLLEIANFPGFAPV